MPFKRIVFSDFDGTITLNETFRKVLFHFTPQAANDIIPQLDHGTLSLREGVERLVATLPSSATADIIAFTQAEPLRPGFPEFLDFLAARALPFVVVSSGLRFYIEARLAPWRDRIHAIHALDVDLDGANMRLVLDHDHPREAMPKEWVLRGYDAEERIAIGDSMSDFEMIKAADRVFARDRLLVRVREHTKLRAEAFEDFFDIVHAMSTDHPTPDTVI